ncbi:MAG: Flp family type IVb pilin [Dehalococcoidia bacterium]
MAAMQWVLDQVAALTGDAQREDGQTMAEYGLILAGIAVVAMVGVAVLGPAISTLFTTLAGNF